jgi:hypothetical protein
LYKRIGVLGITSLGRSILCIVLTYAKTNSK